MAQTARTRLGTKYLYCCGQQVQRAAQRGERAARLLQAEHSPDLDERLVDEPRIARRVVLHDHQREVGRDHQQRPAEQDEVPAVVAPDDQPAEHDRDDDVGAGLLEAGGSAQGQPGEEEPPQRRGVERPRVQQEAKDDADHQRVLDVGDALDVKQPAVEDHRQHRQQRHPEPVQPDQQPEQQNLHHRGAHHAEQPGVIDARAHQVEPPGLDLEEHRRLVQERLERLAVDASVPPARDAACSPTRASRSPHQTARPARSPAATVESLSPRRRSRRRSP